MKRLVIAIFIIFASFLTFSLYRTFAYDTSVVEETPSTTDLEYTFKIGNTSIKQITVDSGETKYYDVVLGNPNPAKISYSIYYEMVSPSTKPDGFSIEYTTRSTGESTGKVDKEGNITLNLVVTNTSSSPVTVKLGSLAGYVNGGELTLESSQVVIPKKINPTATEFVEKLDDGTTGDSGSGVYKVHHDAIPANSSATGEIIEATDDYRYYGPNPNNYICLDNTSDTCEDRHLYRIIGSIYEENAGTNLLKAIKATTLTDGTTTKFAWDSGNTNIWATPTSGRFSDSITSGSSLMKFLNNDFFNTSNTYSLSKNVQVYINESLFYLGGYLSSDYTENMYKSERGTYTINNTSPLSWTGKVGLMYPSDYGYVAGNSCVIGTSLYHYSNECYQNDWLFNNSNDKEWLITPLSYGDYAGAFFITSEGIVNCTNFRSGDFNVNDTYYVRPVFYLKSDITLIGGTGTETDPYLVQ